MLDLARPVVLMYGEKVGREVGRLTAKLKRRSPSIFLLELNSLSLAADLAGTL